MGRWQMKLAGCHKISSFFLKASLINTVLFNTSCIYLNTNQLSKSTLQLNEMIMSFVDIGGSHLYVQRCLFVWIWKSSIFTKQIFSTQSWWLLSVLCVHLQRFRWWKHWSSMDRNSNIWWSLQQAWSPSWWWRQQSFQQKSQHRSGLTQQEQT